MSAPAQPPFVSDPPSRPLALVVAFALAGGGLVVSGITGVLGTLGGALVGSLLDVGRRETVPALVGLLLVASEVGFVIIGYAFRQTDDGAGLRLNWLPTGEAAVRDAALVVVATVGLVAFNRAAFALGALVGVDPVTGLSVPNSLSPAVLAFLVPVMLLAVGPAEEYLFRGVIQGYLRQSFSAWGAVGWGAVCFALVHLPNLLSNPAAGVVSVPVWLTIGLVLGWLYERTEVLLVPVLVHGLYNAAVLTLLFAELGIV